MDCWDILQLAPTDDKRAIRQAYAKKLKLTRPDDDPEGYQRLREAFDDAVMMAPYFARQRNEDSLWQDEQIDCREFNLEVEKAHEPEDYFAYERRDNQEEEPDNVSDDLYLDNRREKAFMIPRETPCWRDGESAVFFNDDSTQSYQAPVFESTDTDSLFVLIEMWHQQGGELLLVKKWQELQILLSQLSLEDSEDMSWRLLNFLTEKQIATPQLWAQWSGYFHWHNDYRIQHDLHDAEIEMLNDRILLAELYLPAPRRFTEYPLFHAFLMRINQGHHFLMTICYAFLLAPFLFYELPEQKRLLFERSHVGIKRLYDHAILWRLVFRAGLIVTLVVLLYGQRDGWVSTLYGVLALAGIWVLIGWAFFTFFARVILAFQLRQTKKLSFIIGILLPCVFILIREVLFRAGEVPFLYLFLLCWIWICLAEGIVTEAGFFYLLMSEAVYFLLLPFNFYPLELTIIWINLNLYLEKYATPYFIRLMRMQCLPNWVLTGWLWGGMHVLRAGLIWLFLLPIQMLQWLLRYNDKGSLWELIVLALIMVSLCHELVAQPLMLFYPGVFLLLALQHGIRYWVLKQIKQSTLNEDT